MTLGLALATKGDDRNPVHEEDGQWYFYDETWSNRLGPFPDRETADAKLNAYVIYLNDGPDAVI
jgi:hypothetical protein